MTTWVIVTASLGIAIPVQLLLFYYAIRIDRRDGRR